MKRLTEKVYCGYDISDRKLENDYTDEEIFKALQKLGRLEDLFEKYQINDIEELEIIIGRNLQDNNKLYTIPIETLEEYRIDKCGNIYSLKTKIYLKSYKNKNGYTYYMINKKQWLMHRLVAFTFLPNPNNYKEVNHKNEVKDDNRVENLEWCTRKYNATYNNCHFRHSDWEKKPIVQYDLQGNFIKEWSYAKEIEQSGIAKANLVKQCCRNQLCQTSNYVWRFKGDTFETRRIRKEYDRTKNLGNYARKQKDGLYVEDKKLIARKFEKKLKACFICKKVETCTAKKLKDCKPEKKENVVCFPHV